MQKTVNLGEALGVSHMMVARVWPKHALKPHRFNERGKSIMKRRFLISYGVLGLLSSMTSLDQRPSDLPAGSATRVIPLRQMPQDEFWFYYRLPARYVIYIPPESLAMFGQQMYGASFLADRVRQQTPLRQHAHPRRCTAADSRGRLVFQTEEGIA